MLLHGPACHLAVPDRLASLQPHTPPLSLRSRSRTALGFTVQAGQSLSWTGKNTPDPKHGKHHFLHIDDFSREELWAMLETARNTKEKLKANDQSYKPLAGKTMSMIFTKPSSRTRISFETVRDIPRRLPRPQPQPQTCLSSSLLQCRASSSWEAMQST